MIFVYNLSLKNREFSMRINWPHYRDYDIDIFPNILRLNIKPKKIPERV